MTTLLAALLGPRPMQVISANALAVLFAVALIWLANRTASDARSRFANYLMCLLGAIFGWAAGILASPLNESESAHFITLGQALSAFISGYLLSKLDRFLEKALYVDDNPNYTAWLRVGLLLSSAILMATVVFVNRSYIHAVSAASPPAVQATPQSTP